MNMTKGLLIIISCLAIVLQSLGLARTSEVQRDARIGEADAKMSTTIKEAIASEQLMKSKLSNDTEIARWKIFVFTFELLGYFGGTKAMPVQFYLPNTSRSFTLSGTYEVVIGFSEVPKKQPSLTLLALQAS